MIDLELPLGKRQLSYRLYEMLPATLTYLFIVLPIILSIISPVWAAIFIIGYLTMFFIKAIAMAYRTLQGYNWMGKASRIDWNGRLLDLQNPTLSLQKYSNDQTKEWSHKQHMQNLQRVVDDPGRINPSDLYNAVIVAEYLESADVLVPTIEALFASNFDMSRLILIITYEERCPEENKQLSLSLAKKYRDRCFYAAAIMHPRGLPNEILGKGGNITFAGRYLQEVLIGKNIKPENVLVTTLDADNRPHPQYLAYVAYTYVVDKERDHRAYQPIALYLNNIWDAPAPMRVLATGNSFWTIVNSTRPHALRNFAAHSQGMASLIATNFWSTRTVVEDGHQYWRSYFTFGGHYEVTPIYVPIYQDAVLAETYTMTIKQQFLQLRRWAYGASDIPYIINLGFGHKPRAVPFWPFVARLMRLIDSHVSWATAPIIITFGAWAPLVLNSESSRSIVAHQLPQIASQLQFIATLGLFITVFLTFKLLPPRPARYRRHRNLFMLLQWVMMPVVTIGFGSAAAIYSQTRLLLGRYLDRFDNTAKAVKR